MIDPTAPAPSPRRRALLGALAGAAALATVATCAAVQATATTPTAAGAHAASAVPWSKVGSGWTVATWAPSANPNSKAAQTVYLLSPTGTRYKLTAVARSTEIVDWTTARGGRMLAATSLGIREINMRTGARRTIAGPDKADPVSYSRPDTTSVLAEAVVGNQMRLVRLGLDGKRLATYPLSVPGAGRLGTDPVALRTSSSIVLGAAHGLVVLGPKGGLVRRLLPTASQCEPSSLLRPGVLVTRCGKGALYSVSTSGGRATRLTQGPDPVVHNSSENPFGYADLWTYSRGRLGLSPNGCGPDSLVRFTANGHGTRIVPPAPVGRYGTSSFLAHHGDYVTAAFHHGGCMDTATTFYTWNAVTGRSTALLGPGVNGGSVTSVAPSAYDRVHS